MGCCVFVCKNGGGGATVRPHMPDPQTAYSTTPVSPAPTIQSPEENLILRSPPPPSTIPPQDESDEEDEEGGGFGSGGGGGGAKKKQWRRNDPPRRQWILQERLQFV